MKTISFDTETWLIAPGRLAPRLVCMTAHSGDTDHTNIWLREDALKVFRGWLEDPDILLVAHNAAFDLGVMVEADSSLMPLVWEALDQGRVFDTQVYEQMKNIALGWYQIDPRTRRPPRYNLAALVKTYFKEKLEGKEDQDAWRFRYRELDGVSLDLWPEGAKEYAEKDAYYTHKIYEAQLLDWADHVKSRGFPQALPNYTEQVKYSWSMHLMSAWGIRTDATAVVELESDLKAKVSKAMELLKEGGIYRAVGSKDMAVLREKIRLAYEKLGQTPPLTEKGAISTSAAVLNASEDAELLLLASISEEQKLLNTFIPILKSGIDRPINARFNVIVASGRSSCRKPNLQNQPRRKGVRDCYIPREGYVFVACDYHVAELCSLAQILLDKFKSSKMAEAIQQGRELHLETAAGILGLSYEEVLRRHKLGDKDVKQARQLAKAANFGFPGGLGAENFVAFAKASYGLELDTSKAKELKTKWLSRYPEMQRYFRDIGNRCSAGPFLYTQPVSGRLRGGVGFCDGCNSGFQGLTADGAKQALHEVVRECYLDSGTSLHTCRPVAFIHDEIILEAPEGLAAAAAERLAEVMVEQMRKFLPDIPVKADAHLMRRWYKSAEPVRNAAGVLIPWEPTNE